MFRDHASGFAFARLAIACAALVVAGCGGKNQFVAPPPPQVTVALPVERPVSDSIEFIGHTEATATVDLRARVNGYLEKINFEDGATVQKGDLLFVIQQEPYQIALEAAKAELERAQATLALAQSEYRRIEPLVSQQAVTQAELDAQAAQVKTSLAGVALAESAVRRAELDLGYTEIRAPITGHIGRHLVDVGNLVQTETTPLAIIQSIDPIYAYFDLSELDLLRFMEMLRKHELPDPATNPPTLYLALANEEGFPHEGRLDFRELGVDPGTGTTMRRGIFPNPDSMLIPGLTVRIHAAVGSPVPKLLVEERAISTDQRGDFVLVVNDKNVVEYRPVKLGIADGPLRVVEEGIGPTDRVIVNGIQRARPGVTVNPQQATEATAQDQAPPPAPTAAAKETPAPATNDATKGESPTAAAPEKPKE
ncbi:MAG: efflux RND transporter periplasmic adaptor subunit [Pirellulales bacterium]